MNPSEGLKRPVDSPSINPNFSVLEGLSRGESKSGMWRTRPDRGESDRIDVRRGDWEWIGHVPGREGGGLVVRVKILHGKAHIGKHCPENTLASWNYV